MKKSWFFVSMVAFASLASAQGEAADVTAGKMLLAVDGARVGAVYRVTGDGSAQLIIDGKLVTVPAASLSVVGNNVQTTLSKSEIRKLR